MKSFISEIIRCDIPNKNGRIYTKECVEKALADPAIQEKIEHKCLFGCFMSDLGEGSDTINFDNVSHALKDYWWVDNTLWGSFDVLDTPRGRALEEVLAQPDVIMSNCVALSGNGSLEADNNGNYVVEDYELTAINFTKTKA